MNYNDIIKDIKAKKYSPIYLLHGEEDYYIDAISDKLEESVLSDAEKAFNYTLAYGSDIDTRKIVDTSNQFPMMSPYRLIIVKEAQLLNKLEILESYVENPNPQTILVLCHKHKKIDARKKVFKAMKKSKSCLIFESKKIYDNKVPSWITSELKNMGYQIEPAASHLMAEYLGADLSKIKNEIDKLIIQIDKETTISSKDIQEHIGISKDYNVFEFQKVLGNRDMVKAIRIINYFAENPKSAPIPLITGSLYGYIMKLFMTKTNANKSNQELASLIGGSPYFMQEYKNAARNYSLIELKAGINYLEQLDLKSKGIGVRSSTAKGLLQEFVYRFIG